MKALLSLTFLLPMATLSASAQSDFPTKLILDPQPFFVTGSYEAGSELSGIAAVSGTECLVVSNETRCAQIATLGQEGRQLVAGPVVPLLDRSSDEEIDLEAICAHPAGLCYYATGSHAVSKEKGKLRPDQAKVFRIPVDAASMRPNPNARDQIKVASLKPWLHRSELLKGYVNRPLQRNGVNIEGLACKNGKLFFGFRAPNLNGKALVVETEAEAFFQTDSPTCVVHQLAVGSGQGIRDLIACRDGFLLVTGNAGSEGSSKFLDPENFDGDATFTLHFWKGGDAPVQKIGVLPDTEGKAEGLLVLKDTEEGLTLLVLFDGAHNGGAKTYRLTK